MGASVSEGAVGLARGVVGGGKSGGRGGMDVGGRVASVQGGQEREKKKNALRADKLTMVNHSPPSKLRRFRAGVRDT